MTVDYKDNEGRDAVALIDWLAKQPEAKLDKTGTRASGCTAPPTPAASSG